MKLYPLKKCKKGCEADVVAETTVIRMPRSGQIKSAKQVHHYRERDEAHFWHWSDQKVVQV